ncbi:fibronectin type III domain-containing protein 11-like [Engraulis encrasicolus]|uniref:fibronectin type III domain-containing protein 11-like n=1 Tax=Engraulis encrasicolus TaxID=184585 RepID=UPI002FD298E5
MSMSGTEATTAPCQSTRTSPGTSSDSLEPHRAEPEVGHAERVQACMEVGFLLQRALSSDLAPSAMHSNRVRLETLRRCSYYLEVIRMDLPLGEHNYMTNSTVLHLIDPWKLQRMKKLANSQVKIQLCLLEELHEQLLKEQQGLDTALECCDLPMLMVEGESIRQRLTAALQTKADFDAMVLPGRLHSKHQLISDMGRAKVPQVRLALVLKMPVHFDKAHSFATANAATLYWHVAGSEAGPDPLEQFELRYKLLQPTCAAEGSEVGVLTCAACSAQVEGLRPDRCYEFSIKRVDSCCLVYGAWIDCIILRTVSASCAGSNGYDKRRRMFQW